MIVHIFDSDFDITSCSITGRRSNNQDSFGWLAIIGDKCSGSISLESSSHGKDMLVAIVCDGMGGLSYGKEASDFIVQKSLNWASSVNRNSLDEIISDFKENVLPDIEKDLIVKYPDSGSTLSMLIGFDGQWVSLHLGDSRLYGINNDGTGFRTEDHAPVESLRKMGLISEDDMEKHPMKNMISYYVGGKHSNNLEIEKLSSWTSLVICSDGAYGCMSRNQFVNLFYRSDAKKVVDACFENGSTDNITVISIVKV